MTHPEILALSRSAWPACDSAVRLEWLETNGLGGWAYGTVPNVNTRFYHAVLAPALRPPTDRVVLLAKLDETLLTSDGSHPLYGNSWATGAVESGNLASLQRFTLSPFPTWTYTAGNVVVQKQLFMRHGSNTTVIRYTVWGTATLQLTPLVTCRSIHAVLRANDWPFAQELLSSAAVSIAAHVGAPRLYLACNGGAYEPSGDWVTGLHYPYEHLRGEHTVEDLYRPGAFTWSCKDFGELTFVASTEPIGAIDGPTWEQDERQRRARLIAEAVAPDAFSQALVLAADQFIAYRETTGTNTIIAGYPWFTDWGRDTMIALPGLTLTTRRYHLARELLHTFAAYERDGLIPNCFPEQGGEPLYNTADASLWFFEAAWQYLQHTADDRFVADELYPVLLRIADAHLAGTRFDIRQADDGLLRCGNPRVQVTWMDAKVDEWVVTPRDGKPVEIQALWYNAQRILAALSARFGHADAAARWHDLAARTAQAFAAFWNYQENRLHDLLKDDGTPDPTMRPNQIFALTLSHPLLEGNRARAVVAAVRRELWTPYGLRSLSPKDPAYKGIYEGTRRERDGAYHQGTVWAWLMGPFIRAYLHAYGRTPGAVADARCMLQPLQAHLQEYGLGTVAENFDGDTPHRPRACVAQAWSVAELLRVWREELQ